MKDCFGESSFACGIRDCSAERSEGVDPVTTHCSHLSDKPVTLIRHVAPPPSLHPLPVMNPPPLAKSIVLTFGFSFMISAFPPASAQSLNLQLRYQAPTAEGSPRFHRLTRDEQWDPARTAVIVCDMWDSHHCVNAVRRVAQLAPRIDRFATRCEIKA